MGNVLGNICNLMLPIPSQSFDSLFFVLPAHIIISVSDLVSGMPGDLLDHGAWNPCPFHLSLRRPSQVMLDKAVFFEPTINDAWFLTGIVNPVRMSLIAVPLRVKTLRFP